jgi:lysophospholipase L1-like esterase
MKLKFEEITSAAEGIVRTEENNVGLELHRFTREQEAFFYKTHKNFCNDYFFNGYFGKNCRTTAGVTLNFVTDAEKIVIRLGKLELAPLRNKIDQLFDFYVDGEYTITYEAEDEISYKTEGGKHRYTIYFPHYAFPIISEVELVGATLFEPCSRPAEILFFGDSITHGSRAKHPSRSYVMGVARTLEVSVLNQGNSGFVYDAGSVEHVCDPKIVVCAYGINDICRKKDKRELCRDAENFLKKVRECYPNAKIVSILPIWTKWEANKIDCMVDDREILHSVYRELSDYIVDGRELIPLDMSLFDDGIHPTEEGFEHYTKNLARILKGILEEIR